MNDIEDLGICIKITFMYTLGLALIIIKPYKTIHDKVSTVKLNNITSAHSHYREKELLYSIALFCNASVRPFLLNYQTPLNGLKFGSICRASVLINYF